jgi:hypothetical protein
LTIERSVTMEAVPETEAHSPLLLRKEMLMWGSVERSLVLPDSVFVWKRRSRPSISCSIAD